MIGDSHGIDPEQRVAEKETRRQAWDLLRVLPERHRQVLLRRYGIGGALVQSHREIGEWLGVKEERSRQLEREALHRLRELATPVSRAAEPRTAGVCSRDRDQLVRSTGPRGASADWKPTPRRRLDDHARASPTVSPLGVIAAAPRSVTP
jgi:hypothetical protein